MNREATSPSPSRPKHSSPNQIETPIQIQSLCRSIFETMCGLASVRLSRSLVCNHPPNRSQHHLDQSMLAILSKTRMTCRLVRWFKNSDRFIRLLSLLIQRERERERRMSYTADMIDGRGFRSGSTICSCDHRHSFVSHCSSLSSSITTTAITTTTAAKRYEPIQQLCLGRTTDCASKSPRTTRRGAALGCQRTK